MNEIPHSKPWITEDDFRAIAKVLESSMLGQGTKTRELEERLAAWLKVEGGVAVGSGSAAIVLALYGLGVSKGDEVILPTYVCRSIFEAVLTVGATPVLCDVGQDWVMTNTDAIRAVTCRTRAIIVPHTYGIQADIESFKPIGIPIIEDCAQALPEPRTLSGYANITVLSFHPTKCLTAGEGGMAVSSDSNILERMRNHRDGSNERYQSRLFSPLSDLSASLALSQLERYLIGLKRRADIAECYMTAIDKYCPAYLNRNALKNSLFFRFPLCIPGGIDECQKEFLHRGIHIRRGIDQLLHRTIGISDERFPVATELFNKTVSIPIYPALSDAEESICLEALSQILPRLINPIMECQ